MVINTSTKESIETTIASKDDRHCCCVLIVVCVLQKFVKLFGTNKCTNNVNFFYIILVELFVQVDYSSFFCTCFFFEKKFFYPTRSLALAKCYYTCSRLV